MENLPSKSLSNDVFQILDSRIQYIEYQLSKLSRQSLYSGQEDTSSEEENLLSIELIFKQIELHNRSLKLLLILRSNLNTLNTPIIFELLTDSRFLDYDEYELKDILGEKEERAKIVTGLQAIGIREVNAWTK